MNGVGKFVTSMTRPIDTHDAPITLTELEGVPGSARRKACPAFTGASAQPLCACNAFDVP